MDEKDRSDHKLLELTSAMIAEGVRVLRSFLGVWDRLVERDEQIVREIWKSMKASSLIGNDKVSRRCQEVSDERYSKNPIALVNDDKN